MTLHSLRDRLRSFRPARHHLVMAALAITSFMLVNAIYSPIATKRNRIAAVERQLVSQRREQELAKRCELRLASARTQCISGDPTVALHQYQQWLLRRAESQKEVTVSPGTVVPDEPLGWRVKIELEGQADLGWIVRLVEDLDGLPLLHRIAYMRINANDRLLRESMEFAMTVEVLVCKGADTLASWPEPLEQREPYAFARYLAEHQPFQRGYQGEAAAPILTAQVKQEPNLEPVSNIDPLVSVGFVGTVIVSGNPMACVVDSRTKQEMFVGPNASFNYATYHGKVVRVSADELVIAQEDDLLHWQLGENLRDAIKRTSIQ